MEPSHILLLRPLTKLTPRIQTQYYLTMSHGTVARLVPLVAGGTVERLISITATPTNNAQVSYRF